ncbi:MAG: PQQ-dependent dehydrogenase, methanol/ethanol family [Candidatus Hydrogenedentes bacterium]|nr:PQQ-dependent dehydrogenase, methanol/ethanol family [Candidatus Hydrogenedentota bacterium]
MNLRQGFWAALLVLAVTVLGAGRAGAGPGVSQEDLLQAQEKPDRWVHYGRNYGAWRYVPTDTINRENVALLAPQWIHQTGVLGGGFEVTALMFDEKLFITTPNSHLICVNARTGQTLWRYDHILPTVNLCCGPVNRGVAAHGNHVYWTTLDAHLMCFDADTGLQLWDRTVADYRESYALTSAPLIVKDLVITGVAGGEYGIRGFIDAYHVDTGERVWRFNTVPGEGEPGNETWEGDSWKTGGAPAWITGTYDPDQNVIFWGVGNPSPDFNGDVRKGDNLYSNAIVALNADTGALQWHFQATPHDIFDLDGASEAMVIDEYINGIDTKAVVQVNRNGFLYALNRTNGAFLYAKPYTKVTWAGFDENGKPYIKEEARKSGQYQVCPGIFGGKNWPPAAYSPKTHLIYLPDMERCATYIQMEVVFRRGLPYYGGAMVLEDPEDAEGYIKAVDVRTGEIQWTYQTPGGPNWGGMLATGGGLVFGGSPDGYLRAFDDETGTVLWEYYTGSGIFAPPTSFVLDGQQYIGIASGWGQPAEIVGISQTLGGSAYILFSLPDIFPPKKVQP